MKASVLGAIGISVVMTAMVMGGLGYIAQPAVAAHVSPAIAQQTTKAASPRIVQLMAPIVVVGHKNGSTTMLLPEDGEKYQAALRQVRVAQASSTNVISAQQAVTIVPSGVSVSDIAAPAFAVRTSLAKR